MFESVVCGLGGLGGRPPATQRRCPVARMPTLSSCRSLPSTRAPLPCASRAWRQPPLRPSSRVKLARRPSAIHLLMYCRHQLCSPYASTSRAAVGQRWLCRHADACKRSMLLFARHHLVPLLPPQLPQQRHRHRRGCCCCPAAPWVCRPGRLLRRLCSGPPRRL